jgi:hypothetical protein
MIEVVQPEEEEEDGCSRLVQSVVSVCQITLYHFSENI